MQILVLTLLKTYDLLLLQALSKRIHYGKFVAEAKFQAAPDSYKAAIIAQVQIPLKKALLQFNPFYFSTFYEIH